MRYECYFCHIKTIEKLIKKFGPEPDTAEAFVFAVHELLSENRDLANPYLATEIHRMARHHLRQADLYAREKKKANDLLLDSYGYWKKRVAGSDDPFFTALRLAVIGNIIDYGAHSVKEDLAGQIETLFEKKLAIDMSEDLKKAVGRAKNILYLGDNCGEMVFDKLFIETMGHPEVTFVVRGKPVINDATMEDACHVGMDRVCRVIENGVDAPSTLLDLCPEDVVNAFYRADLVISKGQGNFEGLMENRHPNLFFLLIAKCLPMAELLGVARHDMVVKASV